MTRGRYEIEFQGSNDGQTWVTYPFRYKPQDPGKRPGIYAPYQPRFEWNLWFASLGSWRDNLIVPAPRSVCSSAHRTCLRCSPGILFQMGPRSKSARCCGDTGSQLWLRNARPAGGGTGN